MNRREFGINFHLGDAIRRTVEFLALQGDAQITPHTRYARWFLDSLEWITLTAIGYSLFALFRPVIYRFRTAPPQSSASTGARRSIFSKFLPAFEFHV